MFAPHPHKRRRHRHEAEIERQFPPFVHENQRRQCTGCTGDREGCDFVCCEFVDDLRSQRWKSGRWHEQTSLSALTYFYWQRVFTSLYSKNLIRKFSPYTISLNISFSIHDAGLNPSSPFRFVMLLLRPIAWILQYQQLFSKFRLRKLKDYSCYCFHESRILLDCWKSILCHRFECVNLN